MCFGLIHVMFIGPDRIYETPSHVKLRTSNNASIPWSLHKQPIDTNMEYLRISLISRPKFTSIPDKLFIAFFNISNSSDQECHGFENVFSVKSK